MFKAVTFDFWNTLYFVQNHTNWPRQRCIDFYEQLNKLDIRKQVRLEDIELAFDAVWSSAYKTQRSQGMEKTSHGHLKEVLSNLEVDTKYAQNKDLYYAYAFAILKYPPLLNKHAYETLFALKGRLKIGLICNTGATPGMVLKMIMVQDGIYDYFDLLVFSDELGYAKPSSDIFKYTLDHLNVDPIDAIHVGDDPLTDIVGAKKAGMSAAWLNSDSTWTVPEADYHLNDLSGILSIIKTGEYV